MKKLSMIAATFAVMFAMVACSSPADKAVSFCEDMKAAIEANDMEKAMKIAEEVMEWEKGLSEEDKKAAAEATANWMKANPEVAEMFDE